MTPTCSICLELIKIEDSAELHCKHNLHLGCVLELRSPTCPICRKGLSSDKLSEEDLQKMMIKHRDDLENIDVEEEDFSDDDVEELDLCPFCENIKELYETAAKEFIKETGLEELLEGISYTADYVPIPEEYPREVKFLIYQKLLELTPDDDFLIEINYQIYIRTWGFDEDNAPRCKILDWLKSFTSDELFERIFK